MKKAIIITVICFILLIITYLPFRNYNVKSDPRGSAYAGPAACMNCHKDIYTNYLNTAHYIASRAATENSVHGSFANGNSVFVINDSQKVVMEKLDSGLFQAYYINGKLKERHRFDIVFGGVKGETYLYWQGNQLYQLPISYYTLHNQWSTSPGYAYNFFDYPVARQIKKQCFECHSSYINDLPGEESQQLNNVEELDKNTLAYSVDCERCHGPAAEHVDFQTAHPEIKTPHFITTYNSLNKIQQLDMCAECHSGKPVAMLRSSFGFIPGDTFANFKLPELAQPVDTAHLDVHGNQLQLLQSSKCYVNSNLTCTTCHDPHRNDRGNDILYAQKCLNCHNSANHTYCKLTNQITSEALKANCIGCHMPALPSKKIFVQVSDTLPSIQFFVHTHHISTYPEEVKKILAYINKKS